MSLDSQQGICKMNRIILIGLHLVSLVLLGFGLVLDVLKIDITTTLFIDINLFNESRSVLGTLHSLWDSENYLPFLLIFLFGIIIPVAKSLIIFYILLNENAGAGWRNLVKKSSKSHNSCNFSTLSYLQI